MLQRKSLQAMFFGSLGAAAVLCAGLLAASSNAQTTREADKPQLEIGERVPDFTLTDTEGKEHTLSEVLKDKKTVVVLEWYNPGCPFVVRHHTTESTLRAAYKAYKDSENPRVVWFAINSGAPGEQGHGVRLNQESREKWGIEYPVLIDEPGKVGRAYGAKVTPHMYVIAADGKLIYQGAIDNDPRGRVENPRNYVLDALKAHFAGEKIDPQVTTAYGCTVKYVN